jgi:predicted Zn-dependent protease
MLTGDASKGSMALETAALLADLSHSREDEEAADREGMNLTLAAGVDPKGMIEMFEKFKKLEESIPLGLGSPAEYLSSHPSTGNRIALLRGMASQATGEVQPLLPGGDWGKIKGICGGSARVPLGSLP